MKKKILIATISTVILIISAGFTSVIGVQNSIILKKKYSPLYEVRSQQAIKNEVRANANYIGKNSNSNELISFDTYNMILKNNGNFFNNGLLTIGIFCIIQILLGLMHELFRGLKSALNLPTCDEFTCVYLCTTPGMLSCKACTTEKVSNNLASKLENNELFRQLLENNPNLAPEILELNS